MVLAIAVDANPILAALLGGYARIILFDPRFNFITTEFTMAEVQSHLSAISKKSGVSIKEIKEALLLIPLVKINQAVYRDTLQEAKRCIAHIDPSDVDILALALHAEASLWTNDEHFYQAKLSIKLLHTRDFLL